MTFKESNVVRAVDFTCCTIIAAIRFGFKIIPYQYAFNGAFEDFWVVLFGYEYKDMTPNFS